MCRPCAAATEQWFEVHSEHFTVFTDAGEKQGRHLAGQFERMRWVFQTLFPNANADPAEPMTVVAAKDEKVFDTMEPASYLAKGQMKLGGYMMHTQDKDYILLQLDAQYEHPYASVYHEYTHIEFRADAVWMPLWLNEGIAEFMQNTDITDKEVYLGQASADNILYLRQERLIPLNVLFQVDARSPYYHEEQKGSIFYAESWALTHYLMVTDRQQHLHRLDDYIRLVSHHVDPVTAGEKAFGNLDKFYEDLESYILRSDYMHFELSSAGAPIDESSFKAESLTEAQGDAARADVLAYLNRTEDARALLDTVLKQDPQNVAAHETMGFLEMRAGHREKARDWYGDAIKLNSQNCLAYYYFATLSVDLGSDDEKQIEDAFRTAIKMNPQFAPAYNRLAIFLSMEHGDLDEAHRMSLSAIQLDPSNISYRANAASTLIEMGQYDNALNVLRVAAKVAGNPGEAEMVQSKISDVEQLKAAHADETTAAGEAPAPATNTSSGSRASENTGPVGVLPSGPSDAQTSQVVTVVDESPKHPTEPVKGPRHTATGVIRGVACSYPSAIEFHLETAAGKSIALYNNNFSSIDLTASAFTPAGSMNPCKDFDGRKAKAQYVDTSDTSMAGQVVAVELMK
ncbi:MAG TPA: tetratricopeptide repeat protein [Terracidiphilus sp.]